MLSIADFTAVTKGAGLLDTFGSSVIVMADSLFSTPRFGLRVEREHP